MERCMKYFGGWWRPWSEGQDDNDVQLWNLKSDQRYDFQITLCQKLRNKKKFLDFFVIQKIFIKN